MTSPARLLSQSEYEETFSPPMLDISSTAKEVEGLWDYLDPVITELYPGFPLEGGPWEWGAQHVFATPDRAIEHWYVPVPQDQTYLLAIVRPATKEVIGHYILDLSDFAKLLATPEDAAALTGNIDVPEGVCSCCGRPLPTRSPFFECPAPQLGRRERLRLRFDDEAMCRVGEQRHFVRCEVEIPFKGEHASLRALGFICWAQVPRRLYDAYMHYRSKEDQLPEWEGMLPARLANSIPGIENSLGTLVQLKVIAGDPTPYVRGVEPGSALAARLEEGSTLEFWQQLAGR